MTTISFAEAVRQARQDNEMLVQPRMGVSDIGEMIRYLQAVRDEPHARTAGTITIDSNTRQGRYRQAASALAHGHPLNGFPLCSYSAEALADLRDQVCTARFAVQIRHGTPDPRRLCEAIDDAGFDATEGGPVSYALPYGRRRLKDTVPFWKQAVRRLARCCAARGAELHVESFGGCMMGQGCPPAPLIAISVLEAQFFGRLGVPSVSTSLALGTNNEQDIGALQALKILNDELLIGLDTHVVAYHWMGQFPRSREGCKRLLANGAAVARAGGAARLITKTMAEAHGIPTLAENLEALEISATSAAATSRDDYDAAAIIFWRNTVLTEAHSLIEAVLRLNCDPGLALHAAFSEGILDIPYCLHPDNKNIARCVLDKDTGAAVWADVGNMPLQVNTYQKRSGCLNSADFHRVLSFNSRKFDAFYQGK